MIVAESLEGKVYTERLDVVSRIFGGAAAIVSMAKKGGSGATIKVPRAVALATTAPRAAVRGATTTTVAPPQRQATASWWTARRKMFAASVIAAATLAGLLWWGSRG